MLSMLATITKIVILSYIFFVSPFANKENRCLSENSGSEHTVLQKQDTTALQPGEFSEDFYRFVKLPFYRKKNDTRFKYLHYAIYIVPYGKKGFVAPPRRLFRLVDGKFKRADRLTTNDTLLFSDKTVARIVQLTAGECFGQKSNLPFVPGTLIKTTEKYNLFLSNNLFLAFLSKKSNDYKNLHKSYLNAPQIGALQYKEPENSLTGHSLLDTMYIENSGLFVPYMSSIKLASGVYFYPPEFGVPKEESLSRLDEDSKFVVFSRIKEKFERAFPDVEIRHTFNNSENLQCFADIIGTKKIISIGGGLIRHKVIQEEGMALVIAHEIGHHKAGSGGKYSNPPNDWSYCEDVADSWAAYVGLKKIWPDPNKYRQAVKNGAEQFFEYLQDVSFTENVKCPLEIATSNILICGHGHPCCRRYNFLTAINGGKLKHCKPTNK